MKRLRKAIKAISKRQKHYLGRLWHWALKPEYVARRRRLKALAAWARDHWALAKQKRQHGRAHKFWKAERAYRKKRRLLRKHHRQHKPPTPRGSLVSFDGHTVPAWIRDTLAQARASGMWVGVVISGYRDPAYSTQLCMQMCGAPQCPGRCAGAASNHSCPPSHTGVPYEGAVDVSDSYGLMRWEQAHGNTPLKHTLPYDLNHHSHTGQ